MQKIYNKFFLKRKTNVVSLLFIVLLLCAGLIFYNKKESSGERISISDKIFIIEKVYNIEDLLLGLGGRSELCKKCGMMFVFENKGEHLIWMKGMNFSLDILWLDGNEIVWIEKNIQRDSKEKMGKGIVADSVIELNAGIIDKYEIVIGDKVIF